MKFKCLTSIYVLKILAIISSYCPVDIRGSLVSESLVYHAGENAFLPCDISVPDESENDDLTLVMWYKEDVGSPIYSVDLRSGVQLTTLSSAKKRGHWIEKSLFGPNRVVFDVTSPDKARLKIFNVSESDGGLYRCRVDFRASQTRTSRLNLTIIVSPSKPTIFLPTSSARRQVEGVVGPFLIGSLLTLSCEVTGGKPPPTVAWLKNGHIYSKSYGTLRDLQTGNIVTVSNITIENLSRQDVHTKFTCEASNYGNRSLTTSIEIDMKYNAYNVTIINKFEHLKAGKRYEVMCEALGSRPAAELTWWLHQKQLSSQETAKITTAVSGELSTATLTYVPQIEDDGKVLQCKAKNPDLADQHLEDSWHLNIQYSPIVSIQLGPSLIPTEIREGIDVYFNCVIKSNPTPKSKIVTWLHNDEVLKLNRDEDMRARFLLPSVNDPNVLVLQGVKKAARGNYSCKVSNGVPTHDFEVVSQPVFLDVKFAPVCEPQGVKVYGVAKMETAHIACNIQANPEDVSYRWTFNNSAEAKIVQNRYIHNNGTRSVLTFTPTRTLEYGTLMCWSNNSVGEQKSPCIFHIIAAGKPDPVQNCSVSNESTDSFQISCVSGFNGGLPQQFILSVYQVKLDSDFLLAANLTSATPVFTVSGLEAGSSYIAELVPHNVKGVGQPTRIQVYTLKLPEKLIPQIDKEHKNESEFSDVELTPIMLTILGVIAGVLIVVFVVTVAFKLHTARISRRLSHTSITSKTASERVIVTTIEELDLDHNNGIPVSSSSTANLMDMDHSVSARKTADNKIHSCKKNPDIVPLHMSEEQNSRKIPMDFPSLVSQEFLDLHRQSNMNMYSNKQLIRPPPAFHPLGLNNTSLDYCTLRKKLGRTVQFSDQHNDSFRHHGYLNRQIDENRALMVPAYLSYSSLNGESSPFPSRRPTENSSTTSPTASEYTFATLRPFKREHLNDYIPPPPPMFESKLLFEGRKKASIAKKQESAV